MKPHFITSADGPGCGKNDSDEESSYPKHRFVEAATISRGGRRSRSTEKNQKNADIVLIEAIFRRILGESKLDTLAGTVTRQALEMIKSTAAFADEQPRQWEKKNVVRKARAADETFVGPGGRESAIRVEVKIYTVGPSSDEGVSVKAVWHESSTGGLLGIVAMVMSRTTKFKPQFLSGLQARLYEAVRHELEHATQGEGSGPIEAYEAMMADPGNADLRAAYYTEPEEVTAFVAGMYAAAKRLRRPFKEVVEESLRRIESAALRQPGADARRVEAAIARIRDTWNAEARRRFPRAIV